MGTLSKSKLSLGSSKLGITKAEPVCEYSNRIIRLTVEDHFKSLKYHQNMVDPRNKFRSDLHGKWDKSQPITDEDRAYHNKKLKNLKKFLKAKNASDKLKAKNAKPPEKKIVTTASGMKVTMTAPPTPKSEKQIAADKRKVLIKEVKKIIAGEFKAWKFNRPIVIGYKSDSHITNEIIAAVQRVSIHRQKTAKRNAAGVGTNGTIVRPKRRVVRTR